jgi:hypothetical protein
MINGNFRTALGVERNDTICRFPWLTCMRFLQRDTALLAFHTHTLAKCGRGCDELLALM